MPTQHKIDQVADMKDRIERSAIVIGADYRGLTVQEMQALRRKLREGGLELRVIKNSLLKIAAEAAGAPDVYKLAEGPTALAIAYDDIVEAAKAITDYARSAPAAFKVGGGYLEGTLLDADALKELTKIPPRPVLIAQFMGAIESPLVNFVALMDSPVQEFSQLLQALLQELPGLIEARARQLESEAA
ncbi:MAG TPA: 50S ribosomal protein L10 [Dehalococcoidia bacterium]